MDDSGTPFLTSERSISGAEQALGREISLQSVTPSMAHTQDISTSTSHTAIGAAVGIGSEGAAVTGDVVVDETVGASVRILPVGTEVRSIVGGSVRAAVGAVVVVLVGTGVRSTTVGVSVGAAV